MTPEEMARAFWVNVPEEGLCSCGNGIKTSTGLCSRCTFVVNKHAGQDSTILPTYMKALQETSKDRDHWMGVADHLVDKAIQARDEARHNRAVALREVDRADFLGEMVDSYADMMDYEYRVRGPASSLLAALGGILIGFVVGYYWRKK